MRQPICQSSPIQELILDFLRSNPSKYFSAKEMRHFKNFKSGTLMTNCHELVRKGKATKIESSCWDKRGQRHRCLKFAALIEDDSDHTSA